jgi:hypothetical protein
MKASASAAPRPTWRNYLPLLVVLAIAASSASAKFRDYALTAGATSWMHDFMGIFLVIFAMLKLFDLAKFADGFQMYDLLAKRFRPYALVYPFIELGLGLGFLAEWRVDILYPVSIAVMCFGAAGVINALNKGLDVRCACMGNLLKVPLSTVALAEDLGMSAMAAVMWLRLM